jgi:hypothetical protein
MMSATTAFFGTPSVDASTTAEAEAASVTELLAYTDFASAAAAAVFFCFFYYYYYYNTKCALSERFP